MEITINVYPQQQNVEIVTEPNVNNINVTTYAVINPQVYDLSEFTNTEVDRFAKLSDIASSIVGYATEAWVNSQGFITNVITALGFTPENVANKTTNIGNTDVNTYPNTPTVKSALDAKQDTLTNITQIANRSYNDLQGLPVIPTINYLNVTPSDEVTSTSLVLVESIALEQKLMESNLKALLTLSIRTIQLTTNLTNTRVEVYLRGETEPNPVLLATAQTNASSRQWMDFEREIIINNNNLVLPSPTANLISNKGTMLNELTEQIPIFNDDAHYLDIFIRRTGTAGTPGTVQKLSTKLTLEKQNL
jgi:hypothetical protein